MQTTIETDRHAAIGPMADIYGHGPVTFVGEPADMDGQNSNAEPAKLFLCLDCGFITGDKRGLAHTDCDRARNSVNKTWREAIEDRDDGNLPPSPRTSGYPISDEYGSSDQ